MPLLQHLSNPAVHRWCTAVYAVAIAFSNTGPVRPFFEPAKATRLVLSLESICKGFGPPEGDAPNLAAPRVWRSLLTENRLMYLRRVVAALHVG